MGLESRFLARTEFSSYEDFYENYEILVPESFNFGFDVVDVWAELEPDKRALVWCDDHGGEKTLSFAQMSRLSNQAVHWFKAAGIGKGDVVLLLLRRRWEYWVCATALCKLGATVVPASLQLTAKDIAYRVQAAGVKLLLCVADEYIIEQVEQAELNVLRALVAGSRPGWGCFDIADYSADFARPAGDEATQNDDLMLMYFTSGTTGMPKMVEHNFLHPLGQIVTAKYWQRVQDGMLHMTVSDSGWAKFGWGKIYGQWICGACIFCYDFDKFDAKKLLEKLEQYRVTTFCAPPTMYRFMLQEDLTQYDLSSVKHCGNAGEPLNPEVYRRFLELTGLQLREGYGQSESGVLVANFPWFELRPGSMGKPSPLYDIDLVDAEGRSCAPGEEGEIIMRGLGKPSGLFMRYHNDETYNSRVFYDGAYHSGDVAWRDDDGYYWFVGRNDDVIKCSGYRIGPFEVESALIEHPAVLECAVTAAPDPVRGQVVKATVVLTKNAQPSDALTRELQAHVKRVTAPYKYPRIIEYVDELPKTVSGKIKRAAIRQADEA